jgi:hypothetical protein
MNDITIRRTQESDIPVVEDLLLNTVNRLNAIGQPLWSVEEVKWNALPPISFASATAFARYSAV